MPWPVHIADIRATEASLQVRFPGDFNAGMQGRNGGTILTLGDTWTLVPFRDTSSLKRSVRTLDDIVRETLRFRELHWFPRDGVVIATIGNDCLVLLPNDKADELRDEVFVWYIDEDGVSLVFGSTAELMQHRV